MSMLLLRGIRLMRPLVRLVERIGRLLAVL